MPAMIRAVPHPAGDKSFGDPVAPVNVVVPDVIPAFEGRFLTTLREAVENHFFFHHVSFRREYISHVIPTPQSPRYFRYSVASVLSPRNRRRKKTNQVRPSRSRLSTFTFTSTPYGDSIESPFESLGRLSITSDKEMIRIIWSLTLEQRHSSRITITK